MHTKHNPLTLLDGFLDRFTSYQLMLYFLYTLAGWAVLLSFVGKLNFSGPHVALSLLCLVVVSRLVNIAAARFIGVPTNKQSDLITALILFLILIPPDKPEGFVVLAFSAAIAMLSKYALGQSRSHMFNPAALGAFVAGAIFHQYAGWWVGTSLLAPLVFVGGMLILRKMKRFILVGFFMLIYLLHAVLALKIGSSIHTVWFSLVNTPSMFFAYVMLIEPLTSPVYWQKYLPYAGLVAAGYSFSALHLSPEQSLLIGNIFSYVISPVKRFKLNFIEKHKDASDIYSFLFRPDRPINFKAGQYMEWTLPSGVSDERGNRRYLTISSSPTESSVMISVRFAEKMSAFKKSLASFSGGDYILASQLAGSFTLPRRPEQKLAFIGGGIGVTPFRSMVKELVDTNQKRSIIMLYSAYKSEEFAFTGLFRRASANGLQLVYTLTSPTPADKWSGRIGRIDEALIKDTIPDYKQRRFYISGSHSFVSSISQELHKLGVGRRQIVADYFPGYG